MINVAELRLNNWVIDGYGNYGQVKNIASDAVLVNNINHWEGGQHDLSLIKPIPLTEELLIKAGFEKIERESKPPIWDEDIIFRNGMFSLAQDTKGAWFIDGLHINQYHFKYVHELQNLFSSLFNTDLIIKL